MILAKDVFSPIELTEIYTLKENALILLSLYFQYNTQDVVLAGGWLVNRLQKTNPKDVDFFVLANDHNERYITSDFKRVDNPNYNSGSLKKITAVYNNSTTNVQVIFTTYKTRKELIDEFDFEHCKVSYHGGLLHMNRRTYDAIKNKKLIPSKTHPPSQKRIDRFLERGYTLSK